MDSKIWVEKMREPDALSLGGNAEGLSVPVKTEGAAGLDEFKTWLCITIKEHFGRTVGFTVNDV